MPSVQTDSTIGAVVARIVTTPGGRASARERQRQTSSAAAVAVPMKHKLRGQTAALLVRFFSAAVFVCAVLLLLGGYLHARRMKGEFCGYCFFSRK